MILRVIILDKGRALLNPIVFHIVSGDAFFSGAVG